MNVKIILSIVILGSFIQCKEDKSKKIAQKTEQISAINSYNFIGNSSLKFQLFSDSSYVFTIIDKDMNHEKIEKFNDLCYSKNDTIYFNPTRFRYNGSEKAVIKNNFIEFIGGEFPLKIEIQKNLLHTKNRLNLEKYNNYAFFAFEEEFHKSYFKYRSNTAKAADLNQKELVELDQILKKCFSDNAPKLRKFDNYINQCIVTINEKQEKEVLINSYCKAPYNDKGFKYSLIQMNDGGNCNISLRINLTKHNYSDLSISGSA